MNLEEPNTSDDDPTRRLKKSVLTRHGVKWHSLDQLLVRSI